MALIVQLAAAADAEAVGKLAQQFAGYLRRLGDTTDFKLTADAYLRDGFGPKPAFPGLVATLMTKSRKASEISPASQHNRSVTLKGFRLNPFTVARWCSGCERHQERIEYPTRSENRLS